MTRYVDARFCVIIEMNPQLGNVRFITPMAITILIFSKREVKIQYGVDAKKAHLVKCVFFSDSGHSRLGQNKELRR